MVTNCFSICISKERKGLNCITTGLCTLKVLIPKKLRAGLMFSNSFVANRNLAQFHKYKGWSITLTNLLCCYYVLGAVLGSQIISVNKTTEDPFPTEFTF